MSSRKRCHRLSVWLLLCSLLGIVLAGCQNAPSTPRVEKQIQETVTRLEGDFNKCMDFSEFINGRSLFFTPLEKYCKNDDAYWVFSELEQVLNDNYQEIRYLRIGGALTGGIVGGILSDIPFFGDVLGDVAESEIENDVLFDEDVWKNVASVKIEVSNIVVAEDKKSASLQLDITIRLDHTRFRDSTIIQLLEMNDYAQRVEETLTFDAEMESDKNGDWVFVSLVE